MRIEIRRSLFLFMLVWCIGCGLPYNPVDSTPSATKEFHLIGEYTNAAGIPNFAVIANESDQEIKYAQSLAKPAGRIVEITFENLRIIDAQANNYEITKVWCEEFVDGQWVSFTEFNCRLELNPKKLGVVLVLDASNSLGNDFKNVQENAREFVNIVFQNTKDSARIGVVSFATDVDSMNIVAGNISADSAKHKITAFIDKIRQGEFTKLYDGMITGVNMLAPLKMDAKALVAFTDGRDNYSRRDHTADTVVARLKRAGIVSFAIGYEGKGELDPAILTRLAVNGSYKSAKSAEALKSIFREFAVTVTDFYRATYSRNDQIIDLENPRRIRLNITARKKA